MLSCSQGRDRLLGLATLIAILTLAFVLPVGALADSHAPEGASQHTAAFNVDNPPSAPFHAHQSLILFTPGAEAALHRHGGPGFITVLNGVLTLFENGVEHRFEAGESLVEVPESLYKGGNYGDENMTLMVTYLVPEGEEVTTLVDDPEAPEPPAIGPTPLATSMVEFSNLAEAFDLIHTFSRLEVGATLESSTTSGDLLITVASGQLGVTIDGVEEFIQSGDYMLIEGERDYLLSNADDSETIAISTEFSPHAPSVLPQTGSTSYRAEPVVWLMLMTALSLLVIGASLRIGWSHS